MIGDSALIESKTERNYFGFGNPEISEQISRTKFDSLPIDGRSD